MEFLKEIFKFFIAKEYSFTSKFLGILTLILTLFFIDNILGFSFYYSSRQKISQLSEIEKLKKECVSNNDLIEFINKSEKKIISRKNIIEIFFNLFSKEQFDEDIKTSNVVRDTVYLTKYDTIKVKDLVYTPWYNQSFDSIISKATKEKASQQAIIKKDTVLQAEIGSLNKVKQVEIKNSRSRIWHTLTSSYLLILLMCFMPIVPFIEKPFNWGMVVGILIISIFIAGLIWFNQYLYGLIPVILNRPWINYCLNFIIHSSSLILIISISKKSKK